MTNDEGYVELTVQNVYGLLIRSKLLSLDEAKAMFARWQAEAGEAAPNLARFAAWMVANKYLTAYQAALLARGYADGFFLNPYKVLDRIGKGRMAGVYKAQHQLGQIVAIKVLPPSRARDPHLLGRFQRESRLALRLKHPNVVRTFQVGEAHGLHYLVMEYLEGETLEEVLLRRSKLPPPEAVRLIYQALQGLQHIHGLGLIHRDLKPANLMLVGSAANATQSATVKVLDIGLGRSLFEEPPHPLTPTLSPKEGERIRVRGGDEGLTGEGMLLGTPDYMAPEQARDARATDIRADIYSLGCVLYHALAGKPPFPDTNLISQMIRHATEAPRPLKELNPAVPDGLQQIVNWMMAKDPSLRYPTPERAAQALQVFLAAAPGPLEAPEADPRMRSFLTWLEMQDGKKGPPAVPAAKAAAVPGTTPTRPGRPAGQKERSRSASGKRRSKKGRRSSALLPPTPPGPAGAPPVAVPVETINVELVPLPLLPTPTKPPRSRPGRRDFLFFGVGVAAGAVATSLGCWFAFVRKREPRREEDGNAKKDN
jgi:serine/threonine protein kinase